MHLKTSISRHHITIKGVSLSVLFDIFVSSERIQTDTLLLLPVCMFRPLPLSLVISYANNTLSLTSVAWSAWSLMLMKACNSLSDPRLMGESQGLFVAPHGSTVLPWLGWLFHGHLPGGCGPKRLSFSVSLSLDSLDNSSGSLEAVVVCILEEERRRIRGNSRFKSRISCFTSS